MTSMHASRFRWWSFALAMILASCASETAPPEGEGHPAAVDDAPPLTSDPIAVVGHGALIDSNGAEIVPDRDFVFAVQQLYLEQLEAQADEPARAHSKDVVARLARRGLGQSDDERAFLNTSLIGWLARESADPELARLKAKNTTLYLAYQRLRAASGAADARRADPAFPAIEAALRDAGIVHEKLRAASNYADDCARAGVPTPPTWGSSSWIRSGELTNEFLSPEGTTEVYYYSSSSPRGTCIALPRSNGNNIFLLGIICHGVDTSKACFWDNSNVTKGTVVPIASFRQGDTDAIDDAGRCTDCHAGTNPFVIHPNTPLDVGALVPAANWASKNWYDPLIYPTLAQNPGPTNAIASLSVPAGQGSCNTCHSAIRLPELSTSTGSFCGVVLDNAIARTMPPSSPGNPSYSTHAQALRSRCSNTPASSLCEPDNAKICAQASGYCEQAFSTTGGRHDLCRWPAASTEAACNATAGLWTTASSGFAAGWPTAVPSGAVGACITQMRNIGGTRATLPACTSANRDLCRRRGGFCEDATSTGGGNHQLCRWPNHDTAAKCASTAGIWTAANSGFAAGWPTAVRRNEAGSCITQMRNIGGTRN